MQTKEYLIPVDLDYMALATKEEYTKYFDTKYKYVINDSGLPIFVDEIDSYEYDDWYIFDVHIPLIGQIDLKKLSNNTILSKNQWDCIKNGDLIEICNEEFIVLNKEEGLIGYEYEYDLEEDKYYDQFSTWMYEDTAFTTGIMDWTTSIFRAKQFEILDKSFAEIMVPIPVNMHEEVKRSLEVASVNNSAIKQIITGETGCGKTYTAINDEKDNNRRFLYVAPCRQLVNESFMKYAEPGDRLTTGEVKIGGELPQTIKVCGFC